jgi:hypothetical protein
MAAMAGALLGAAAVMVSVSVALRSTYPRARPVTVTVAVPMAAVAEAVSVSVEVDAVPTTVPGLNEAMTPAGRPVAARAMSGLMRPRAMVTVTDPLAPCAKLSVDCESSKKGTVGGGAASTTNESGVVTAVTPDPVARTVSAEVPGAAVAATRNVSGPVVWPAGRLNAAAVTPTGSPSTVTTTASAKPFSRVRVTGTAELPPWTTPSELTGSEIEMDPSGSGPAEPSPQLDMENTSNIGAPTKRRRQRVIILFLPLSTDRAMLYTASARARAPSFCDDV